MLNEYENQATFNSLFGIHKIKLDLFVPDWIKDYLEELHKYFTAEGRQKREERKKALEGLGY